MAKIKVIIADNNFLTRKGLVALTAELEDFTVVAEAENQKELLEKIKLYKANVLIIDHSSDAFKSDTLLYLSKKHSSLKILAITEPQLPSVMSKALETGVTSYLLKDCSKDEIIEALYNTNEGKRFLCGKIVDRLMQGETASEKASSANSCAGLNITDREIEVIKMIAEGHSNKEIADLLFLSTHTVTTHRKNIMSKLGVNNTAGVVMFAVKENLLTPNKFLFS